MSAVDQRRGFTLVEAVIVAVVIAVMLAVSIPWLRERERARLQVLADTEPWEVFEFRAKPAKESFAEDEDIILECVMVNLTNYPLTTPANSRSSILIFEGTDYFTDNIRGPASLSNGQPPSSSAIPKMLIGSEESARFDVRFRHGIGVGAAEVRVGYWDGGALHMKSRSPKNRDGNALYLHPILSGILPSWPRFQSNSFQLLVIGKEKTELTTFNEITAELATDEIAFKSRQRE
jgi:prepilin-type N-terminal cleavage/methylation domain-containing protein